MKSLPFVLTVLAVATVAFVGGMMFAQRRAQRAARIQAPLPTPPRTAPTSKSTELDEGAIQYLAIAHMQKTYGGKSYLWVGGPSDPVFEAERDMWRVPLQARPKPWEERKRNGALGPVASVLYATVDVKGDGTIEQQPSTVVGW